MGYIIGSSFIIRRTIVIPEADVLVMDNSQPFTLVTTNSNFFAIPIYCNIKSASNQTIPYDIFTSINLTNTSSYTSGDLCGTYTQNASSGGVIDMNTYAMLINYQIGPTRIGGVNGRNNLEIFWDPLPVDGNGDLIVNLGYMIQPL